MEHYWKNRSWVKNCLTVATSVFMAAALIGCRPGVDEIARPASGITAKDLATYTRELADDSMLGRAPGGEGEAPTLAYLQAAYERIGLIPVGDSARPGTPPGSPKFFQQIEMVAITADSDSAALSFSGTPAAEALELKYGSDFVTWTTEPEATLDVSRDLVFVGYGINAPEEGWNDYRGVDVTDKIVLVLVNDPPLEDQSRFGGTAMTYYGRWIYKIEEAARQGASGVLLIHDTEAAGYGWNVIRGWVGELPRLPPGSSATTPVPFQGWVSWEAASRVFESAGLDLEDLAAAAARDGFRAVELGITGAGHLENSFRDVTSHNVVGTVKGSDPKYADEYIIYLAHWDHFGVGQPVDGDAIYNGAIDNATGTAALLEIAEGWSVAEPKPRRSALFMATTAEEWNFMGAAAYIEKPAAPLDKTVAVINIDSLNVWGPTKDLMIVGMGQSTLDDDLTAVLMEQGRSPVPDPEPEKGYYYRADHFPFALAGIPSLYAPYGVSYVGKPEGFYDQLWGEYEANHYHQPSDEFDPGWDFSGAEQDVEALLQVGLRVSAADTWPEWRSGSEFKAARDTMLRNTSQ